MNFYRRVLKDDIVDLFFIAKLGDDMTNEYWKPHLKLLVDFWASIVALNDTSYRGNPFAPHRYLGELSREVFHRVVKTLF